MGRSMNEIEKAQQQSREALLAASRVISEASAAMNKAFKDVRFASEELEARLSALSKPVEREYRAGEWVPEHGKSFWFNDTTGLEPLKTTWVENPRHPNDAYRLRHGNVYPTQPIAEAAKAHADWWREFDKIRDEAAGETARAEMYLGRITYTIPPLHIGATSIERLGGEQKVIEMLNAGRVFRFKWGGQ